MNKALTKNDSQELAQVGSESSAVLSMIERAASDPNVDVFKMEKLLDMQERVLDKRAESEFFGSLNRCQSRMTRIATDSSNGQTKSRYASYAALDRVLRPIYTEEGLSLSFDTEPTDNPDTVQVLCYASNGTYTKRYSVVMPADGKGAKGGDVMTKTHATGSAMSYGMRYLLKMIFNVAIGEDDTDGNMPAANEPDVTDWLILIKDSADLDELKKNYTDACAVNKQFKGAMREIILTKNARGRELSK